MDALEAISKRYSCRAYKPEQISEEDLTKILRAGMSAPVASNGYDSLHITVIQDQDLLNDIGNLVTDIVSKFLGRKVNKNFGAPTMIIVSAPKSSISGIEMANAGCVLENMSIAATSLGIDNIVWGAASALTQNEDLLSRLEISKDFKPVLAASFGYAIEKETAKPHIIEINRV